MGSIYLVRHAQASFGTDDYDRLSGTGFTQARLLGAYFLARKARFDAVCTGTLRRHSETAAGIFEGRPQLGDLELAHRLPELDEYDSAAVIAAFEALAAMRGHAEWPQDPDSMRGHFRLLRKALLAWAEDGCQPEGMPTWRAFQAGAVAAIDAVRHRFANGQVLVVSSGGPISAIVAASLLAPPRTAIELNLRMRNSSLSELASSSQRHQLVTFNTLPHLDAQPDPALITYA